MKEWEIQMKTKTTNKHMSVAICSIGRKAEIHIKRILVPYPSISYLALIGTAG